MKKIGLCITGSFCTFSNLLKALDDLIGAGYDVIPVFSYNVSNLDTRFYKQADFERLIVEKTGKTPVKTIVEAETITKSGIELMLVAPCTGNTLAKIVGGITDTPTTMAVKATLRTNKPVVLSISSNDALGANAQNVGIALNTKNLYLVPFGQDAPDSKPHSLIADTSLILPTIEKALNHEQIQPIIL